VAGAVQDWDRGVVIGRKSFGKGLVQQMLPMNDGSQLRLTVARYHTPSGRVIQSPYEAGSSDKYYKSILERYQRGESFNRDSIHFPDSLKFKTLVKGRTVYGGGGIMPDIFIPADTSYYTNFYGNLLRRGIITDFMNDYNDSKREALKATYKNFDTFFKGFKIDDALMQSLVAFAAGKGVVAKDDELSRSRSEIELFMKALTARSLFGTNGYFRVINNTNDQIFAKALEVISTGL
jgi:carboxyl-terminal processing protease